MQHHRQCVEHLPRILNSHVSEGAQTVHSFRVRLHRIQMICYARVDSVKVPLSPGTTNHDHSASFPVNLGGLPSRRSSTSIVLGGLDPSPSDALSATCHDHQFDPLRNTTTCQKRSDSPSHLEHSWPSVPCKRQKPIKNESGR